jgi:ribosome-associated protein
LTNDKLHRDFSSEAVFSASRSSGPGGQAVNKINTKVELRFSIANSLLLNEAEKAIVLEKLANRINNEGELLVVAQNDRSQLANKINAQEKLNELIESALKKEKKRIPTKTPRGVIEKRLKDKKIKSEHKNLRKPPELN